MTKFNSIPMTQDEDFMSVALDLARLGLGRTSPNPAVGAVLVKKGRILSTGFHKKAGSPHAEIEAMTTLLGKKLYGATLYVTLEPCCPPKVDGRTPPCTDAIVKSGIKRVVIGMRDPDPRVVGKGIRLLKKSGIRVREGVLQKECEALNEAYVKHRKMGRPLVLLKMATTLDGKVGLKNKTLRISGVESQNYVHHLRDSVDAILVGRGTVVADDPHLTTRLKNKKGKDPQRIILDSRLRIPLSSRVLALKSSSSTWIATTVFPSHPRVRLLQKKRVSFLFCRKDRQGRVDLKDLLEQLGRRNILSLLVEGGPSVASSFLAQRFVDKILLLIAPQVLGSQGIPAFKQSLRLTPLHFKKLGNDLLIEGFLPKNGR